MIQNQPAVILVEAQLAENIGAAARAMLNFGLSAMRLVSPRPEWPNQRATAAAAGADAVLRQAVLYRSTLEAIADCQHVYAASARPRDMVKRVITPEQAGCELRLHAAAGRRTALVFGPERTGLVNDDVVLCDTVITAPVNPEFSSLNLAQAVLLMAYEWRRANNALAPTDERPPASPAPDSPIADKGHVMSFLLRLEKELDACGFLRVSHMRAAMVRNLRCLFTRAQPTDQEIRILHGVLTELVTKRLEARADDAPGAALS